jgi:transcriptional regulator with GAF, ATPase, and Fis domain
MTMLAEPCEFIDSDDGSSRQGIVTRQERKVTWRRAKTPMVGNSEALLSVVRQAEQVAATGAIVLILGETGTGKELLAQHMHGISPRSAAPFITTNIAAIPATLLESELFGRERGAYTGAMNRQMGRFEVADGATLFLDEIGEMPLETQAKLLRVLENGEFERLGSSRTLRVDVRVIAATNRKFPELLRAGSFRPDLFYRLSVFPLTMPPLRDRVEDIPALVWAFVKEFSYKMGKPIERVRDADLAALQRYHWPGNVRELRNVVERSMILTNGVELRLALPDAEAAGEVVPASRLLRDVEQAHIMQVLKSTNGRIRGNGGAAEILGLKPTTLYSLMQRLGIKRAR